MNMIESSNESQRVTAMHLRWTSQVEWFYKSTSDKAINFRIVIETDVTTVSQEMDLTMSKKSLLNK